MKPFKVHSGEQRCHLAARDVNRCDPKGVAHPVPARHPTASPAARADPVRGCLRRSVLPARWLVDAWPKRRRARRRPVGRRRGAGRGSLELADRRAVRLAESVADPLPSPTPSATPVARRATVPILYYHRVQPVPQDFSKWTKARQKHFLQYDALPKAFVAQLDWLAANGYTTILPGDLAAHWDHGTPLPLKPVIITFDDGSRSWTKRVMQALQERGMVAEFYLTLDAIKADAIDWGDIRKLVAAGNGIGAHDVHHVQIAGLPGGHDPPVATMWREINDIRAVILANVGVAPDSMSYVGGGYDKTLLRLVAGAGYTTARSINRGIVQTVDRRYQPARRAHRSQRRRGRSPETDTRPRTADIRGPDARRQRQVTANSSGAPPLASGGSSSVGSWPRCSLPSSMPGHAGHLGCGLVEPDAESRTGGSRSAPSMSA